MQAFTTVSLECMTTPTTLSEAVERYRAHVADVRNGTAMDIQPADTGTPMQRAWSLLCTAYRLQTIGDFSAAEQSILAARELLHERRHAILLAIANECLAWTMLYVGRYPESISLAMYVIEYANQRDERRLLAGGYTCVAHVFASFGATTRARTYLDKARDAYRTVGFVQGEATCLCNLAELARAEGNTDEQRDYLHQASALHETIRDRLGLAAVQRSYGYLYEADNNTAMALTCFEQASALYTALGCRNATAEVALQISLTYTRTGKARKGLELARRSLAEFTELGHKRYAANSEQAIAFAHYQLGSHTRCILHLQRALRIAKELDIFSDHADIQQSLATVYAEMKDYEHAYQYSAEAVQSTRRLLTKVSEGANDEHALVRQTERLMAQATIHLEQVNTLREQLQRTTLQLETNNRRCSRYHQILTSIRERLRTLRGTEDEIRTLYGDVSAVLAGSSADEPLSAAETSNVDTFAHRLRATVPSITRMEARVAAFILMDLPTKEIANILQRSSRTIENQRLSLRKKLGIATDQDITDVLRRIVDQSEAVTPT